MTAAQTARAIKVWLIVDGNKEVRHFGTALSREDLMEVVDEANKKVEAGHEVGIMLRFRLPDVDGNPKFTKAQFSIKSVLEPYELFSFEGGAPESILAWSEEMNFDKPDDEPAIQPGESFVHLTISDKNAGVIGRVTAFLKKTGEDTLLAAFSFCNKADAFSKHTGRIIARRRMHEGKTTLLHKYRSYSRFDTVRTYIEQMMTEGKSCLATRGEDHTELPQWLNPQPHPGIPEPIAAILKKVLNRIDLDGSEMCDIQDYLGLTGKHQTKMVLHHDEVNKFSQEDLTS